MTGVEEHRAHRAIAKDDTGIQSFDQGMRHDSGIAFCLDSRNLHWSSDPGDDAGAGGMVHLLAP